MGMRAAYIDAYGPPEAIHYGELPLPVAGPTDVLVRIEMATVNPVDTFVRSGAWRTPLQFPFVVGRDLVGTVATVGPGTTGFAVGDRVWCNSLGHAGRQGAAAEYAVVPAKRLYHAPENVPAEHLVALAHPAATAYLALFTHGRLRPGETVVVAGAGGNVGGAMTVMANAAGLRVLAIASARDAEYCSGLGADEVFDYRDPLVAQHIREACPDGANAYVDAAGYNNVSTALDLLTRRGRLVLLAGKDSTPALPVGPLYLKDRSVVGFAISQATSAELAEAAQFISRLSADGRLRARNLDTLPLGEAAEAHRRLEAGELHGRRIALRVSD